MNFAGPVTALDRPAAPLAPLIDPFARAITYLRVSVTDRCDFRCVYCMAEHMSFLPKAEPADPGGARPALLGLRRARACASCASPAASRWSGAGS